MANPCNNSLYIGRIGNNVSKSMKTTNNGNQVADVTLICPRPNSDKTDRIPIKFWDKTAENLAEWTAKGDLISVSGSLRVDLWETDSGEPRQNIYVQGERFHMLESRRTREERQESRPQAPKPAAKSSNAHAPTLVPGEAMLDDDDLPPF